MSEVRWKILSRFESLGIALFHVLTKASRKHRLTYQKKTSAEKIFVMGNGPSFDLDYEKHKSEIHQHKSIAVNFFARSTRFEEIKPAFYILADGVFFQSKNQLSEAHFKLQQEIVLLLNEKVNWKMQLIFPSEAATLVGNLAIKNPNITYLFFNGNKVDSHVFTWFKHWALKSNWASVTKMNVLISATYCALNLGFTELILLGANHSWSENFRIDFENRPFIYDPHFYNEGKEPVYLYKNALKKEFVTTHSFFQGLATAFQAYWELKGYATRLGATIKNATENSYIDAFERY